MSMMEYAHAGVVAELGRRRRRERRHRTRSTVAARLLQQAMKLLINPRRPRSSGSPVSGLTATNGR